MNQLKIITYNVDGLPEYIDLNNLHWILKPISYIYKLFKKTTKIKINDNVDLANKALKISKYFANSGADLICVQEDFNYHDNLTYELYDKYCWGTHIDIFNLSKIFTSIKWLPYPRFKSDGLNLYYNANNITLKDEDIIHWKKSYGYFSHANDKLLLKGFRRYTVTIDNLFIDIDIYNIHMDADFYDVEKCNDISGDINTRKSQLCQLTNYIIDRFNKGINNPIIIVGDTNSSNKNDYDRNNIELELIHKINHINDLEIKEAKLEDYEDVDKIFYINNKKGKYRIELNKCYYDFDISELSDHKPLIGEFNVIKNN